MIITDPKEIILASISKNFEGYPNLLTIHTWFGEGEK